jgi:hypothetical protein
MSETYSKAKGTETFKFQSSALSVGGNQVGAILGYSASFGPITKKSLTSTAGFPVSVGSALGYSDTKITDVNDALIIQAASGDTFGKAAQIALGLTAEQAQGLIGLDETQAASAFNAISSLGYPSFLKGFINGAQQVVDSGDSSIWATKSTTTPTLAHQVVGNGADNLSDQVVPNNVIEDGYPLAGTYGLIQALGLEKASTTIQGTEDLRNYVNFTEGDHGSSLDPTESLAATTEMQTQILSFILSKGKVVNITDTNVVE